MCLAWWWWRRRHVLISPLEEATLLVSGFPTRVEHPALVWTLLLDSECHHRLTAVTHDLPRVSLVSASLLSPSFTVPEAYRGPQRPLILRVPRLIWFIRPQKEVAAASITLVELTSLVGTVFAHSEQESVLTTVTHNGIVVGVHAAPASYFWSRVTLRVPGGDMRKGWSGVGVRGSGWLWYDRPQSLSRRLSYTPSCSTSLMSPSSAACTCSEVSEVQHLYESLVTSTYAANEF